MVRTLKILFVEDDPRDVELALAELKRARVGCTARRVDTEADFRRELVEFRPDIILSDFSMPKFDGITALAIAREFHPEIPFVFLSGTIGEEHAIRALKNGATDYVLKSNLIRLPPAVERAVQDAKAAAEKSHAEAKLRELDLQFQATFEQAAVGIAHVDLEGRIVRANTRLAEILGYGKAELVGRNVKELARREDRESTMELRAHLRAGDLDTLRKERQYKRKDGSLVWVWITTSVMRDPDGVAQCEISVFEDVTANKRADQLLRLEHTVAQILADASSASKGLIAVIRAICETEGWECGRYFRIDERASVLRFSEFWNVPDPSIVRFVAGSRAVTFATGVGLVGQVWQSREPLWTTDVTKDARVAQTMLAREAGIHGAFVFPAVSEGKVLGVFSFSSREVREPKPRMLQTMRVIGNQVGQFVVRMAQQESIARLNRIYAVLSGINALIVRVRDRDELFQEACRIAVEAGGFRMAWVGVVDKDATRVKPIAWQGAGEDYIQLIPLGLKEDRPAERGLASLAIGGRKPMITDDMTQDPRVHLRKEASERGFHSLAMLPLIVEGAVVGVLALYASEIGFFDDEEMKLLLELAGDISFAVDHLEKAERLDYLAYYDATTGVANRRLFLERMDQRIRLAAEQKDRLAVVILDIERFKTINDSLGRRVGDALLEEFSARFANFRGDPDRVGRFVGDQFAIVIPDIHGADDAARRLEQDLKECLGSPFLVGGAELRIAARAGIAVYPEDGGDGESLSRNAEVALRKAKAGGERYLFYAPHMSEKVAETLALENKLRLALEREEYVLHYQPKVDTRTRRITGVEALIRWQSPEQGLVPPMRFIPLMEETGIILEVGAWALRRAVMDHRRWIEQKLAAPRVAVNVSANQLRRQDFVSTVTEALKPGPQAPGIDLEITESLVMENLEANMKKLEAIRQLGMDIAVDDFGTGYSSLAYLAKLPVQTLKIDRSFIITMLKDPAVMSLVSMIISLAHSLKLKVVAEGVDAEDQVKALERLDCDQMQGYLFSKPVPRETIDALLKSERANARPPLQT
jgi:diguanylate cyclase (GGDEF)-like protein/PAS domain S-box-containing protein